MQHLIFALMRYYYTMQGVGATIRRRRLPWVNVIRLAKLSQLKTNFHTNIYTMQACT